jgi:hypothetical protein
MNYKKPIILRALWTPTKEEAEKLREYVDAPSRNKILYVPGRQPYVSFLLKGRDPVDWIEAGETYFLNLKSDILGDGKRVRRAIQVFPWDLALPKDLPKVDLDYLLRPITVLEAWRAARDQVAIVRRYRTGEDRIHPICGSDDFEVSLERVEDQSWMGDVQFGWEEMQSRMDAMDAEDRGVRRPDWRLVTSARKEWR